MPQLLKFLFQQNGYMAPAGDGGSDTGGTGTGAVDRGDDFIPTDDDAPAAKADAADKGDEKLEDKDDTKAEDKDDVEAKKEDDDQPRDEKGKFIPKSRFDEAVRKERDQKEALARQLKEYQDKEAQSKVTEDYAAAQKAVKDMIKQHTSLLADGELDKASDLMEKILEMKEEMAERKAEAKALSAKESAKEEMRYDALVQRLETDYPALNPDAEEYDKAAVKKVQAYMTGLMQTERMTASQALKEAVETLLTKKEADKPAAKAEDLGMRRKEAAVAKALDAKAKQPASTKDVGVDHDKNGGPMDASAIQKLSWDEFVKLPESKLAEMRGDFVN